MFDIRIGSSKDPTRIIWKTLVILPQNPSEETAQTYNIILSMYSLSRGFSGGISTKRDRKEIHVCLLCRILTESASKVTEKSLWRESMCSLFAFELTTRVLNTKALWDQSYSETVHIDCHEINPASIIAQTFNLTYIDRRTYFNQGPWNEGMSPDFI